MGEDMLTLFTDPHIREVRRLIIRQQLEERILALGRLRAQHYTDPQELLQYGDAIIPPETMREIKRVEAEIQQIQRDIVAEHLTYEYLTASERPRPTEDGPQLDEKEAARLMKRSPKHLGNLRRAGLVPRQLYQQLQESGRVTYYREKFVAWIANKTKSEK